MSDETRPLDLRERDDVLATLTRIRDRAGSTFKNLAEGRTPKGTGALKEIEYEARDLLERLAGREEIEDYG